MASVKKLVAIDLFSGAGGLSEGFLESGRFDFVAHVEREKPMVNTLRNNLIKRWNYTEEKAKQSVILFDIQKTEELLNGNRKSETLKQYGDYNSDDVVKNGIKGLLNKKEVDVIVGGPPCQAYSIAGRAQDPNSMKDDYRNFLFESFVKVVDFFKPKLFVFENVPGILSAMPGDKMVIERIYDAFDAIGYEIRNPKKMRTSIYSAADFEVPQDRRRVIIVGIQKNLNLCLEDFYKYLDLEKVNRVITVRESIGNMPKFFPLNKPIKIQGHNVSHTPIGDVKYSHHKARYHSPRDVAVFKEWISKDMNTLPNEKKLEFYHKITGKYTNHNKYRNIEWDKPSPTIVAHIHKDGLMFIHPDIEQLRSITIREAATLQSFPLDYEFIGSDAYCFKMIGNAVPVLFAKHIAQAVYSYLGDKYEEV